MIEFQRPNSRQKTKILFLAIPCEELGRSWTKEEPTQPSAWCCAWKGSTFFIVGKSSDLCCQAVWQKLCKGKEVLCWSSRGLGCWWIFEVQTLIRNTAGRPVSVPGSCFQYRQDMTDCRLVFPTSQYTRKYLVCTSAVLVSENPRQEGGLQRFVNAKASSVATQLLQGGENAFGCCPALQAEALRRMSSARCLRIPAHTSYQQQPLLVCCRWFSCM